MPLYEHVMISRQDLSNAQAESLIEHFSTVLKDNGGSVVDAEYWGIKTMAYKINKNRKGHYVMLNLEADNDTLREYERIMGLNEDVLRFMNIRIEEVEEGPSIMMQVKTERPTRGGRDDRDDRDSGERNSGKAESNDSAADEKSED